MLNPRLAHAASWRSHSRREVVTQSAPIAAQNVWQLPPTRYSTASTVSNWKTVAFREAIRSLATVAWSRSGIASSPTKSTRAVPSSMSTPAKMLLVSSENTEVNPRSRSSASGP